MDTVDSETLRALETHAPALAVFGAAVHRAALIARVEEAWDRFGDGTSQRTWVADFVLVDGAPDLEQVVELMVEALERRTLQRLELDEEWRRQAFMLEGSRCLRVRPARLLLLEGIATGIRLDLLAPSSDREASEVLAPELAAVGARYPGSYLSGAKRESFFDIGTADVVDGRLEARFRTPDERVVAAVLDAGELTVEERG